MGEELLKAIPVFLFSALKFILGPTLGFAAKLHFITTVLATVAGMMTAVLVVTYSGSWIRQKFFKKKRRFSSRNRKLATIWRKYGLHGVAFLTPLILTPIGGTLLAVSGGSPRERIIFYMFVSAAAWSLIFSGVIYVFGNEVIPEFLK